MGRFTYALSALPPEARQTLLMLARFAEFSGAGRMTGQGLGQVRIITMDENQRRKYLQMSRQYNVSAARLMSRH